jgi:hypothetical protein
LHQNRRRVPSRSALTVIALATTGLICACGGGGGSGSSAPAASPTPRPSPVVPITSPGPSQSTAEIILRDGDRIAGDLLVTNIEDAAIGSGGAAAMIVTLADAANRSAIVTRAADGTFSVAFDPRTGDGTIDATSLTRLRMAPTGELVFQSGKGLDTDRLHRIADGALQTLAGGAPGAVFPDFRILGNVRIAASGVVAFVGGGSTCEVTTSGDEQRVSCTNALYVADESGVTRLDDTGLDLTRQRANAIRVELDPAGGAWFSLPRRGSAPILLRYAGGEATTILDAATSLPGIGELSSAEAVSINAAGQVLIEGGPQQFSGDRRPQVLGVLDGQNFAAIASEGTALGGANVAVLRGLALDGAGRALFEAHLGDADAPATQINSLWWGNDRGLVEIVREGTSFPGETTTVVQILGARLNAAGDVVFVTELGTNDGGVMEVQETRATVRRSSGRLVTIASSRHTGQFGELGSLQIVGYDDAGTVLLLGTRGRSSDRLLLLGRSDQTAD